MTKRKNSTYICRDRTQKCTATCTGHRLRQKVSRVLEEIDCKAVCVALGRSMQSEAYPELASVVRDLFSAQLFGRHCQLRPLRTGEVTAVEVESRLIHAIRVESERQLKERESQSPGSGAWPDGPESSMPPKRLLPE